MPAKEPPSDTGFRRTVAARFSTPVGRRLQVVAQTLFDGVMAGAIESMFLEFSVAQGHSEADSFVEPLLFPSPETLTSSQDVGRCFDDMIVFMDVLSTRLESLTERGRTAVIDQQLVVDFIRATGAFPAPFKSTFEFPTVVFEENHAHSFTLLPHHVDKIDVVGKQLFGRDRKRRAVIQEALFWFSEAHGLTDLEHTPTFTSYPHPSLVRVNRYLSRHLHALLTAMTNLSSAVGQFRLWTALDQQFEASANRLGYALFGAARRD